MSSSEDLFGPPQWELDSVMKTSVTRKFKVKEQPNPQQVLRNEMEAYRRDIAEKNNQIQKLTEKHEKYKQACSEIHDLILEFEKVCSHEFFTKEQREKQILITHMDYVKLIKESIHYIIQQDKLLEEKFTQDFSKIANVASEKLVSIRNEFLDVRKQKENWISTTTRVKRLYAINERERKSLQQFVDSLTQEKEEIDNSTAQTLDDFKSKMDKLREERKGYTEERAEKEKKYNRIIQKKMPGLNVVKRIRKKHDTTIEDNLLQKEIQELLKRYDSEAAYYDKIKAEYDHILNEIERGKEHIEKHRKALSQHELDKAQKINQDLKEYIEKERVEDKIKYDSQVKKNKELERTIKEHMEEQTMLKQYLAQLEKKIAIQAAKLPVLQTTSASPSPTIQETNGTDNDNDARGPIKLQPSIRVASRHKNDDLEMKLIKRAMSTISRKKQVSKTLNLPQRYY